VIGNNQFFLKRNWAKYKFPLPHLLLAFKNDSFYNLLVHIGNYFNLYVEILFNFYNV
jgi:hypothetical protein